MVSQTIFAQASPELSMRDFASGQVKKGLRSIGFGRTLPLGERGGRQYYQR
jgi:hypothetical protein